MVTTAIFVGNRATFFFATLPPYLPCLEFRIDLFDSTASGEFVIPIII